MYYILTEESKEIRKCKGIGHHLTREDYLKLLEGKTIEKVQERWNRNPIQGYIQSKPVKLTISSEMIKRQTIINNQQFSHTLPLIVKDNVFIK